MKTIAVTQQDIDQGVNAGPYKCALALALRRSFGCRECDLVRVTRINAVVRTRVFPLPPEATQFVHDYDHRRPVQPFSFVIDD